MRRPISTNRGFISVLLIFQFIPLLLFPASSFSPSSQEWWLPVLLAILAIVASLALVVRHSTAVWPWNLMAFSQGFNIISRLMMLWAHATVNAGGAPALNTPYIFLTLLAMFLSAFLLLFLERPDVRMAVTA